MLGWTKLLTYLLPSEKKRIEFDLPAGVLRVSDIINGAMFVFVASANQSPEVQLIPVKLMEGKFRLSDRTLTPLKVNTPNITFKFEQFGELAKGKVVMEIENLMDKKGSIWIVYAPPDLVPPRLEFETFLSGKRLLTNQTFRDLFRSEVVQSPEGIGVRDITFLFTDLKGSTALYDVIGDPTAYYLVRQHFDTLGRVIADHSGAIVKTIGDAVMATFMNPVDAMRAAIDMLKEIETFNRGISQQLILKIGIHRGHSIVVTLNDRLDYFGQTVNIASRVQGLAGAGEIYVSQDIYDYPGVQDIPAGCEVTPDQAMVKGVSEKIEVYKISHHPSPGWNNQR
jgi:class 3 adenylate cyclase